MNRFCLIIVLLYTSFVLSAQNIIVNTYNEESHVFVAIPFSQLFFSADNPKTQYQLSLNIVDARKKNTYEKIYSIILNKDDIIDNSAYVIDFPIILRPGLYKVNFILRNSTLGDKKERQFEITIPGEDNSRIKNFILADNGFMKFIPSGFEQLNSDLKSCLLLLDTSVESDSIIITATIDNSNYSFQIPQNSGTQFDLLPIIQSGKVSNLELRIYTGNIFEIIDDLFFLSNDEYAQRYTPKEQLQQIKYVANQNEWKVINRIAQKDPDSAIEYFWERHNNSPGILKNELRELFYDRVLKADELFTIHKKLPGWKSDRGMIFIRKGNPDDIVEETFPIGRDPYIIWYYYMDNTAYYFIDKSGFGNYRLEENYREN